jgi:hypothetical protein
MQWSLVLVLCVEQPLVALTLDYIMTIVSQTPVITTMCIVNFWAMIYIHTIFFKKISIKTTGILLWLHIVLHPLYIQYHLLAYHLHHLLKNIQKIFKKKIVNKHLLALYIICF